MVYNSTTKKNQNISIVNLKGDGAVLVYDK